MNQLSVIQDMMYIPEYNPETDTYHDKSPFESYERLGHRYICRCKVGSSFRTKSQFSAHIKTQTHQNLLHNYKIYYRDTQQYDHKIKALTSFNELLTRKVNRLSDMNNKLTDQVGQLREERDISYKYIDQLKEEDEFLECQD